MIKEEVKNDEVLKKVFLFFDFSLLICLINWNFKFKNQQ